jgi:hypothetical protein
LTKIKKSIVLKAKYFVWKANTVDFKRKKLIKKLETKYFRLGKSTVGKNQGKTKKLFFQQNVGVF